jgi:hypothetical protein
VDRIWPIVRLMRLFAFLTVISIFTGVAAGQTTRPSADAPPQWERLVSSLTAAVVAHDSQAIQSLVAGDCRVGRFYAEADADDSQLLDAVSADIVLGDHAYVSPAAAMAADIAQDVNSSSLVSDFAKRSLNLGDQHARSVAMQWMAQALNAGDGEFVGIIILWDSRPETDDQHRLSFVLVKGQGDGQGFKFSRVVYGDPLQ